MISLGPVYPQRSPAQSNMYSRLPPILRPRWTWKYVVCSAAVTYIAYCWLFSMPLFAHNLPKYTGQYPVGAIDIEASLEKPQLIHEARLKETGEHAFKVETVLFTLYYPAAKAKSKHAKHYWIPKPLALTAEGYARFAHISNYVTNTIFTGAMGALVGSITIPAKVDVPLASNMASSTTKTQYHDPEKSIPDADSDLFPVIVFSHGMASSRTDYTHYLGELASRGYVVAAIEHRDGSSPGSLVCHHTSSSTSEPKCKPVLTFRQSSLDPSTLGTDFDFKATQLSFRDAEIAATVSILKRLNSGHGTSIFTSNPRGEGRSLPTFHSKLDTKSMTIAGHSYGATGALGALRPNHPEFPFTSAIILDPGKNSGPLNSDINVPTLIIHSNSWSSTRSIFMGRPHFEVVRDIARGINERGVASWFVTSLGTSHPSVTDAPLIEPMLLSWTTGASIDVVEGVRQYVHVSEDFLTFVKTGMRRGLMKESAVYDDYGADNSRTGDEWRRYWQVHVAPKFDRVYHEKQGREWSA